MTYINSIDSIKTVLFSVSFLFSRIPYWFLFIAMMNGFLLPSKFVMITAGVALCRSYTDSELHSTDFFHLSAERFVDFLLFTIGIATCYITALYYGTAADSYDKMLIAAALFLIVILYYDTDGRKEVIHKYIQPLGGRIVCTLGWLYLSFIPDSIAGNLLMLVAIYMIEIQNFAVSQQIFIEKNIKAFYNFANTIRKA